MFRTPVALLGAATLSLGLAIAPPVLAEMEVEVARDSRGRVYTVDMDSRRFYRNSNGIAMALSKWILASRLLAMITGIGQPPPAIPTMLRVNFPPTKVGGFQ
ncbi:hypothetical protein [Thermosynechococcus sp. FA-CM-4201]